MPFIPGILMSRRTISGFSSLTFCTASLPSAASPQTRKSCQVRKDRMVFRATELSSTMIIRADRRVLRQTPPATEGWVSGAGAL